MLARIVNTFRITYSPRITSTRFFASKPDDKSGRKIAEKIFQDAKDFANSKTTKDILNKVSLEFSKLDLEGTKIKARKYFDDARNENKYIKDIADSKYFKMVSSLDVHLPKMDFENAAMKAKKFFILEQPESNINLKESENRMFSSSGGSSESRPPSGAEYHRPIRVEPGKVELGFIPTEWVQSFHPKTGVTGFYTFFFTFGIYLASKEILVMEHEYYSGLSTICFWWIVTKNVGPLMAKSVDKEIDAYEKEWNEGRVSQKQILEESIADEEKLQNSADGQLILVEAKRENVHLQLEAEFRERQMRVYREVMKRLDYQIMLFYINRRHQQANLIEWTRKKVMESITPEFDKMHLEECFKQLQKIADRERGK